MKYLFAIVMLFVALPAFAQSGAIPTANAPAINLSIGIGGTRSVADLAQYIGVLYKWMVGAALVVAAFMISVGGFQYVASGGVPKMVSTAKTRIRNSLVGLLLVLGSYVLLYSINPAFTSLQLPVIQKIVRKELQTTGFCPNDGANVDRFKCGQTYTSKDGAPVPSGGSCIGKGQCGAGECLDYPDPQTGVKKWACLSGSQCPTSCAAIEQMAPGSGWFAACGSSTCNQKIPGGCYVQAIPSSVDSSTIYNCVARRSEGQNCSASDLCQPSLLCDEETGKCANIFANLADGRRCTLDKQCKSGLCDATDLDSQGRGTCLARTGKQTNGAVCYKSETDPDGRKMCGDGFVCVSAGNPPGPSGTCSDRTTGESCFNAGGFECASAADECVFDEGANHGICQPRPTETQGAPNS